jgi:hypothetical protein
MVAIVVAADAVFIRARIRLRTRATHNARRPTRGLGPQGWRNVSSIGEVTGIAEAGEVETIDDNPFASMLNRRPRR